MKTLEQIKNRYTALINDKKHAMSIPGHTGYELREYDSKIKALSFVIKNYNETAVKNYIKKSNENLRKMFYSLMRNNGNETLNHYYKETEIRNRLQQLEWCLE